MLFVCNEVEIMQFIKYKIFLIVNVNNDEYQPFQFAFITSFLPGQSSKDRHYCYHGVNNKETKAQRG